MTSVVVDASVLVAAVLDTGPDGDWARSLLARRHLIAPQLAPVEAGNVLRRAELARQVSSPEATVAYRDIVGLQVELLHFEPFAARIWELRFNLTTYDAWYVACAEALGVPLATLDARLSQAPVPVAHSCYPTPSRRPRTNHHDACRMRELRGRLHVGRRLTGGNMRHLVGYMLASSAKPFEEPADRRYAELRAGLERCGTLIDCGVER